MSDLVVYTTIHRAGGWRRGTARIVDDAWPWVEQQLASGYLVHEDAAASVFGFPAEGDADAVANDDVAPEPARKRRSRAKRG